MEDLSKKNKDEHDKPKELGEPKELDKPEENKKIKPLWLEPWFVAPIIINMLLSYVGICLLAYLESSFGAYSTFKTWRDEIFEKIFLFLH